MNVKEQLRVAELVEAKKVRYDIINQKAIDGVAESRIFKDNENEVKEMLEEVKKLKIVEKGKSLEEQKKDLGKVTMYTNWIKDWEKWGKAYQESFTKPLYQGQKKIIANIKPFFENLNDAKRDLEGKVFQFHREENKRLEEIKRKEEAKIESGYQKQETAEKKIETAEVNAVGKNMETNGGAKNSIRTGIDIEVINIDIVPKELLLIQVDRVKAIRLLRENPELEIKGIKKVETMQLVRR